MYGEQSLEYAQPTRGKILKKNYFLLPGGKCQLIVNSPLIKGLDLEGSSPFCARIVVTLILCISYHFCYNHSTTQNKVSLM